MREEVCRGNRVREKACSSYGVHCYATGSSVKAFTAACCEVPRPVPLLI